VLSRLTPQELQVVQLAATGLSSRDIGALVAAGRRVSHGRSADDLPEIPPLWQVASFALCGLLVFALPKVAPSTTVPAVAG
jgi:hypothetical protein